MMVLFEHCQKREYYTLKFQAGLQGVDLDKELGKAPSTRSSKESQFLFRDPKDYEHLSQEEREELTQKMMGMHKSWARSSPLGKGRL